MPRVRYPKINPTRSPWCVGLTRAKVRVRGVRSAEGAALARKAG